jgi:hypothetical protein
MRKFQFSAILIYTIAQYTHKIKNPGSIVSSVPRPCAALISGMAREFPFLQCPEWIWCTSNLLFNENQENYPQQESCYSMKLSTSSTKVRKKWSYTITLHIPSWCAQMHHYFTFYIKTIHGLFHVSQKLLHRFYWHFKASSRQCMAIAVFYHIDP